MLTVIPLNDLNITICITEGRLQQKIRNRTLNMLLLWTPTNSNIFCDIIHYIM